MVNYAEGMWGPSDLQGELETGFRTRSTHFKVLSRGNIASDLQGKYSVRPPNGHG